MNEHEPEDLEPQDADAVKGGMPDVIGQTVEYVEDGAQDARHDIERATERRLPSHKGQEPYPR